MSDIIIQIDLDSKEYNKNLNDIEKKSEESSKKIGNSLDKNISETINKSVIISVKDLTTRVSTLAKTIDLSVSAMLTFAPSIIFLEQRFNVFSKILSLVGLDLDNIIDRLVGLKNAIFGFARGESSVFGLKIAFGKLLEELGLVDSAMLSTLNSIDNIGVSARTTGKTLNNISASVNKFIATVTQIIPIMILIENRTGLFSKTAERLGLNVDDIKNKIGKLAGSFSGLISGEKGFFGLKISAGLLLQELGLVDSRILRIINTLGSFNFNVSNTAKGIGAVGASGIALHSLAKNMKGILGLSKKLSEALFKGKGIFGLTSAVGGASVALLALGKSLENTNNALVKTISTMSIFTGILLGSLAAAISFTILKVSELSQAVGTSMVAFFSKSAEAFNQTDQNLQTFSATVSAVNRSVKGSIGIFRVWEAVVGQIADTFNFSRDEIRKSAQEILLVGPKLGLVESQMRKLLRVSAEYAKINKKEVFQTTVNFVNALNGNAQAVSALGVKLSQASLQQFAYHKGITRTIASMGENEKVQLRFNKVMKQYADVAGIGVVAANTLADQTKRLKINQDRLNASLGEGARIIEQNNLLAFAYNTVLDNVNQTVFKTAGFLGALGARFLQIGGFVLGFTFKIYALVKAFKILKAVLASDIGIRAFASNVPFLNKSLNQLISGLAKSEVRITSFKTLMSSLVLVTKRSGDSISKVLFGTGSKGLTVFKAMSGALGQVKFAVVSVTSVLAPFLIPLAQFAAIGAVVIGAVVLIYKALSELEKRTQAFSEIWAITLDVLRESKSVFQPLIDFAVRTKEVLFELARKGFGVLIFAIAGVISSLAALARKNPFGVFSEKTIESITSLETKLDGFSNKLQNVGFDIGKLSSDATRSIAGFTGDSSVNFEELARKLEDLRDRFQNFGLSQIEILKKQKKEENSILDKSFSNGLILERQYLESKHLLQLEFRDKLKTLRDEENEHIVSMAEKAKAQREADVQNARVTFSNVAAAMKAQFAKMGMTAGELAANMRNLAVSGFGNSFKAMGRAMATGQNAMQAFANSVKAVFGDLASALGDFYIKNGIATYVTPALGGPAVGGPMIAAGAALKVLSGVLGASGTSGGTAGSGGGASVGTGGLADTTTGQLTDVSAERPDPEAKLVVNIQGDYFDNEDSGNRLVDLIQNTFDKQGVKLQGVATA